MRRCNRSERLDACHPHFLESCSEPPHAQRAKGRLVLQRPKVCSRYRHPIIASNTDDYVSAERVQLRCCVKQVLHLMSEEPERAA